MALQEAIGSVEQKPESQSQVMANPGEEWITLIIAVPLVSSAIINSRY